MRASRKWYVFVEGFRGFHLSYCRPSRTNYMTFYLQNQIKYLQCFYSILVDVRVRSGDTQLRDGFFRNSIIYLETRDIAPHIIYFLSKGRDRNQCFATGAPQMQATFSKPDNSRVGQLGRLSRLTQESFNSYRMVVLRNTGA